MITKKYGMLFLSIFFAVNIYSPVYPVNLVNALRWVKQKFVGRPVTRAMAQNNFEPIEVPVPDSHRNCWTVRREILFENNMPQFFDLLKDDPSYANVPALIDQTICINGQAILPGTSARIMLENNRGVVTIKLHKGFAKLIYAMQQGALRGVLMKLLKQMEPWLQWQYSAPFTINDDIDYIQLSDLVLAAYNKSLDQSAVNHRFKWILVVDLSLNETIDL